MESIEKLRELEGRIAELERLVANRDESIRNLTKLLDKRQGRIHALESLVCDMRRELDAGSAKCFRLGYIGERMRELGLEDSDGISD